MEPLPVRLTIDARGINGHGWGGWRTQPTVSSASLKRTKLEDVELKIMVDVGEKNNNNEKKEMMNVYC